jgi:post-segregation antitoxin (ccd killing protein)
MGSLTISVDDQVLERARARALADGTTVEALLQEYLTAVADADDLQSQALADLLQLSAAATSRRGHTSLSRDELHRRRSP